MEYSIAMKKWKMDGMGMRVIEGHWKVEAFHTDSGLLHCSQMHKWSSSFF